MWWLMSVITATWEVEIERLSLRPALAKSKHLNKYARHGSMQL
jgi:hypothetical protein